MSKVIRIGTRDSQLAMWQAKTVQQQLESHGYKTQLVPLKSTGDLILNKPLYELGITGIFTKTLDIAMLNEDIDIAVHSFKDVPTILPHGIVQAAVIARGNPKDIIVYKTSDDFCNQTDAIIATGSLRRKAQWLHKYSTHSIVNLRGNVNSRLQKLEANNWNAAIFAAAGLERIEILPENAYELEWMIPAPSQGAVMITALKKDTVALEACAKLNHKPTEICTHIERTFLNTLEGGCTAPIGGFAQIKDDTITFEGVLLNMDGTERIAINRSCNINDYHNLGKDAAKYILEHGGAKIMAQLKRNELFKSIYSSKKLSKGQQFLLNKNLQVQASNAIEIHPKKIDQDLLRQPIENVIITSKNAVNALLENKCDELNFKNIYCVGRKTKNRIENHIGKVTYMADSAKLLAEYLVQNKALKSTTYFCSDLRLDDLPQILKANNIDIHEVIAYKTTYSSPKINTPIDGAMFYSPSTVKSFVAANRTNCIAFCIGKNTATEARKYFRDVRIAKVATIESVIELVNENYV
ncbi:MAG: hydroxymethylbilane synthase [Flavobacteriaceae bacterium]|nr:hydroxymethylbilane synthase [Flavobacteriaceae bacterium]